MNKKFRVFSLHLSHVDIALRPAVVQRSNGKFYNVGAFDTLQEAEEILQGYESSGNLHGDFVIFPVYELEMD